jgi:hypothetical protein
MAIKGDFTPLLAKHSKNFNLIDNVAVRRCSASAKRAAAEAGSGLAAEQLDGRHLIPDGTEVAGRPQPFS